MRAWNQKLDIRKTKMDNQLQEIPRNQSWILQDIYGHMDIISIFIHIIHSILSIDFVIIIPPTSAHFPCTHTTDALMEFIELEEEVVVLVVVLVPP